MHVRRGESLAAGDRFGTCSYSFGNKFSALLIQSCLVFYSLQHKCVGRFIRRLCRRNDASLEICGNLNRGRNRGTHSFSKSTVVLW